MFRPAPNKAYATGEAINAVPQPSATTQVSPRGLRLLCAVILSVLNVKADRIYNNVSAGKRIRDRPLVSNIGLDRSKLRIIRTESSVAPIWML
jgi:hypothetical protein